MDNYIDFYSIPYNKDSFNQPYFKTSESRDSFFARYTALRVNALGVNINLKYDYQFELKVNVDVVNMDGYNFAILNYNSKKFYCNIDDYEQISVNRSRVKLTRNPVFEVIDFFQYFTNLLVERDGSNYLDFTTDSSNVSTYKGRYRPENYNPTFTYYREGLNQTYHAVQRVYIIFMSGFPFTSGYPDDISNPPQGNFEVDYPGSYDHNITLGGAKRNYSCFLIEDLVFNSDLMDAISPYVLSMHVVAIPFVNSGDTTVPLFAGVVPAGFKYKSGDSFTYTSVYSIEIANTDSTYFETEINFTGDYSFNKLCMYIGSTSNKLELNYRDFVDSVNGTGAIKIRFKIIISQSQISYYVWYYSESGNSPLGQNNMGNICIIPLITNSDYVTDAAAKWSSENRYYDQLTNNAIQLRTAKAASQTGENLLTGLVQIGMGAGVLGYSNIARGVFEPINGLIDNEYYSRERDLLEAQAKSVPDTLVSTSDSQGFYASLKTYLLFVKLTPFSSDFNRFKQDLLKYGTYVNKCIDTVDTSSDFIIKAVAQRNTSALPDMQYNKLYEYVRAGHKYIIGG